MRAGIRTLLLAVGLPSFAAASEPSGPASGKPPSPGAPAARRYRLATRHTPTSVRTAHRHLDWSNKPALYPGDAGAAIVSLPSPARLEQGALAAIGAATPAGAAEHRALDRTTLGTILFFTGGIIGARPDSGGDLRATASAGALYPNETYAVVGPLSDLDAGVYHYEPKSHRLTVLRSGDWRGALATAAADETVRTAPATVVLTGILWRTAWKYGERGYRHLFWDSGMMLAHILAAAEAVRLPARVLGAFIDEDVDRLVGADGLREMSLALVALGAPASRAPSASDSSPPPPLSRSLAHATAPHDHPEALRYHAASRLADAAAVTGLRRAQPQATARATTESLRRLPEPAPARGNPSLDAVIRRRRSTRRFARQSISAAELAAVLERPTRGAATDFLSERSTMLEVFVIVNAVDHVPPGSYRYDPQRNGLEPIAAGDFRSAAGFLCLEQALAYDASAVVFYLSDLEAAGRAFGERGYRLAELEAGLVAGRAYLTAYATGRGATGLTFYDDEVPRFFAAPAAGLEALLVVAVGVPRRH
jgi:SagB-type dehydrogenase family enzyme